MVGHIADSDVYVMFYLTRSETELISEIKPHDHRHLIIADTESDRKSVG